jgi:hypothetical protein
MNPLIQNTLIRTILLKLNIKELNYNNVFNMCHDIIPGIYCEYHLNIFFFQSSFINGFHSSARWFFI